MFIFLLFIDKTLIAATLVGFVGKVKKLTKIGRHIKQRVCVKVIKSVVGRRGRSRTWKEGLGEQRYRLGGQRHSHRGLR